MGTVNSGVSGCSNPVRLSTLSQSIEVSLQRSAPGSLQAAALNRDNSSNSATNPAERGSVVQLWATGAGATIPALPDGTMAPANASSTLVHPIQVYIGGALADVLYAGAAPGLPAGVVQINVRVPQAIPQGETYVAIGAPRGYPGPIQAAYFWVR